MNYARPSVSQSHNIFWILCFGILRAHASVKIRQSDSDLNYNPFYRTIPPLTYKHIEIILTKEVEIKYRHVNHSPLSSSLPYIQLHITPNHSLCVFHTGLLFHIILRYIIFIFLIFFTSHTVSFYYFIFFHLSNP